MIPRLNVFWARNGDFINPDPEVIRKEKTDALQAKLMAGNEKLPKLKTIVDMIDYIIWEAFVDLYRFKGF